jgi:uncharacterized RDD family membrane protein YckC
MTADPNPYAPPRTEADATGSGTPVEAALLDASGGQRFANLLVDMVARWCLAAAVGFGSGYLGIGLPGLGAQLAMSVATMVLYYMVGEALFGRTVGKLVTGTKVVDIGGGNPSVLQVLGRTAARFVPFEPFSYLGDTNGWHDRWSRTRVVRVRR